MEIAVLPHTTLRIKGKQMSLGVDQVEKNNSRGTIALRFGRKDFKPVEDNVLITGAGDYEVGGIKITGTRSGSHVVFSIAVDGIDILLGKLPSLDAMQHKLKEHNVVVVLCEETAATASFLTALASNAVLFYGEKAAETSQTFGKENVNTLPKYQTTKDKLPAELETVILQ